MMSSDKEKIHKLEEEIVQLREENNALRKLLSLDKNATNKFEYDKNTSTPIKQRLTSTQKINLFKNLFRGRSDVHAIRWENKSGKTGYSPVCTNEWDRRFCRKPAIKCSQCAHQNWTPLNDKVLYEHLVGAKFVGIYPLLADDTCYFLAVDFDKDNWKQAAKAFYIVCYDLKIPVLFERSQSGNGAHIWIFFKEAISAKLARQLGTLLLTKTMMSYPGVSMNSYDRLFPNQDTMPKGGFGNLIALPLQGKRREIGNSVFIDKDLQVIKEPWSLLSSIAPMGGHEVKNTIESLNNDGIYFNIKQIDPDNVDIDVISDKTGKSSVTIKDWLPKRIEATLSSLIYIPIENLPPKFILELKAIASFGNPEFYRAQKIRLSTYGKPRIICCFEETPSYLALPRGCIEDIQELCSHNNVELILKDDSNKDNNVNYSFSGTLSQQQEKAFENLSKSRYGILSAATGFGKTVLAAKMIAQKKLNTLILVHRQQLLEQWQERLSTFLNIQPKEIGILSGGKKQLSGKLDIAMLQSLHKSGKTNDAVKNYSQIIVDECHHISAFSFEHVLKTANPHSVLGLTATPIRKDGHHPIIMMQCGPIRYKYSSKKQIDTSHMNFMVDFRTTSFSLPLLTNQPKISEIYSMLINDTERNELIFNDVLNALENGRTPILLTERTAHVDFFKDQFSGFVKNIFVFKGGMKQSLRSAQLKAIDNLDDQEERLIIATGKYIGEGFDDAKLDTLFLGLPVSWQGTLQQYVGRLHREYKGKNNIIVYDYVDPNCKILNSMYLKRLKKYQSMGYSIQEN